MDDIWSLENFVNAAEDLESRGEFSEALRLMEYARSLFAQRFELSKRQETEEHTGHWVATLNAVRICNLIAIKQLEADQTEEAFRFVSSALCMIQAESWKCSNGFAAEERLRLHAQTLNTLAKSEYARGNSQAAHHTLQRSLQIKPLSSTCLGLSSLYTQHGRHPEALTYAQGAHQLCQQVTRDLAFAGADGQTHAQIADLRSADHTVRQCFQTVGNPEASDRASWEDLPYEFERDWRASTCDRTQRHKAAATQPSSRSVRSPLSSRTCAVSEHTTLSSSRRMKALDVSASSFKGIHSIYERPKRPPKSHKKRLMCSDTHIGSNQERAQSVDLDPHPSPARSPTDLAQTQLQAHLAAERQSGAASHACAAFQARCALQGTKRSL